MPSASAPLLSDLAVTLADVQAAAGRLAGVVHRTPLLTSQLLDARVGARVVAKAEHLQRTGSFKIRGAYNRLVQLTPEERAAGVVAFSSGNHAQGVALAAKLLGIKATIVMPLDAPAVKKQATRDYGATVVEYDRYTDNREKIAAEVAGEKSAIVPPFNDLAVIAGQGTVGLEVIEDFADIDVAVLPVGGGGLASGIAVVLKTLKPSIRIYGIEPASADDALQSLRAGKIVTIAQPVTVADGVATPAIGAHTFPLLSALLDDIVTVSEEEILSALGFIVTRMKQAVEPTGALTTAALLEGRIPNIAGKNVLTVFCGGNLDPAVLGKLPK
jgi:threo-3-hydroxy-L-aspartate ammonia-lyase